MPLPKDPVVITQASAISVGLTRILIVCVIGGTLYLANLNSNVGYVAESLQEVKLAVNKNTDAMIATSQKVAIYESEMSALKDRLARLEKE